jgi:broad specificity phosphatase PhoE
VLLERHRDERIALVVHGGVMGVLVSEIFGAEADMTFFSAHASVCRLRYRDGRWVIGAIHEVAHLQEPGLLTF